MKKTLTTIALSITGLIAFAQQDAQFSMNMFNKLSVNPGYAGTSQALCGTLFYRQQWTSFPGAPKTGLFSLDYGRILHGGLGLTVDQDQLGFDKTLKAKLAYSFHLSLGNAGTLGIGVDAGMIQKSITGNFIAPDGSTGSGPDNSIPWGGTSATTYDVGFGLYFTGSNLYVGISSLHLPAQSLSNSGGSTTLNTDYDFQYQMARHYFVMAGYKFNLGKDFSLTPGVLAKSDASSTQVDINLYAKWRNMVFVGASYRLTDAIPVMAGLEWPLKSGKTTVKFGYSYDVTLSSLKTYSNGSHEIMLGFCQKFVSPPKKQTHMNVRFL